MRIIGYAYEADLHCVNCAIDRFGAWELMADENGIKPLEDREGNPIHPIFSIDEHDSEPYCGDCLEPLE